MAPPQGVVDEIEMSDVAGDVAADVAADVVAFLAADTTDVLAADTTDVFSAGRARPKAERRRPKADVRRDFGLGAFRRPAQKSRKEAEGRLS